VTEHLTCPVCFFSGPWEGFATAEAPKRFMMIVMKELPKVVEVRLPEYLGLFKQSAKRGLSWTKLEKLVQELSGFIKEGHHSWDGQEARFIPPDIWAEAMDATIKGIKTALTNHNYLRHTAYDMADMNRKKPGQTVTPSPAPQQTGNRGSIPGSEDSGFYSKAPPVVAIGLISEEQAKSNLARLEEIKKNFGCKRVPQTLEERRIQEEKDAAAKKAAALIKLGNG